MGAGNSFESVCAVSGEGRRLELVGTQEVGNANEELGICGADGGRGGAEGSKSASGGNEIIGKISASTSLFSQSFHAPLDREDLEIAFSK